MQKVQCRAQQPQRSWRGHGAALGLRGSNMSWHGLSGTTDQALTRKGMPSLPGVPKGRSNTSPGLSPTAGVVALTCGQASAGPSSGAVHWKARLTTPAASKAAAGDGWLRGEARKREERRNSTEQQLACQQAAAGQAADGAGRVGRRLLLTFQVHSAVAQLGSSEVNAHDARLKCRRLAGAHPRRLQQRRRGQERQQLDEREGPCFSGLLCCHSLTSHQAGAQAGRLAVCPGQSRAQQRAHPVPPGAGGSRRRLTQLCWEGRRAQQLSLDDLLQLWEGGAGSYLLPQVLILEVARQLEVELGLQQAWGSRGRGAGGSAGFRVMSLAAQREGALAMALTRAAGGCGWRLPKQAG